MAFGKAAWRSGFDGSFDEQVRKVAKAAKQRLVESGVWEIEEEAEREIQQRTAAALSKKAA